MKPIIYPLLLILIFNHEITTAQDSPKIWLDQTESYASGTQIKITAQNFNDIGSCNLRILYDPTVMLATSVQKGPQLYGSIATNISEPGKIVIGWFTYPSLSIPGTPVIFKINFTRVNYGMSELIFNDDGFSCAWSNGNFQYLNDLPTSDFYLPGSLAFLRQSTWTGNISEDWFDQGNWTDNVPDAFTNTDIPSAKTLNQPTINNEAFCYRLVLNAGSTLTIENTGYLTSNGELTNNGELIIRSGLNSDGSFIDNGTITGSGVFHVERFLTENKWHYISSPVSGAVSGTFFDIYLMEFDEETGTWHYITGEDVPLIQMKGYGAWADEDLTGSTTITYTGMINSGPYSMNLTNHQNAAHNSKGFNFTGNPYPSALNWESTQGWETEHVDNAIYLWNSQNGQYGTYVKGIPQSGINGVDSIIPAGQGFFVHVNTNYANGSIIVNNKARLHHSKPFMKNEPENGIKMVKIGVQSQQNHFSDETLIIFSENATNGYDPSADALKLFGLEEAPALYSIDSENNEMMVQSREIFVEKETIPIHFIPGKTGNYMINLKHLAGFGEDFQVFLEDLQEERIIQLNSADHHFHSEITDGAARFVLHLTPNDPASKQDRKEVADIYAFNGEIVIKSNIPEALSGLLKVFDITGRNILEKEVKINGKTTINIPQSGILTANLIIDQLNVSINRKLIIFKL